MTDSPEETASGLSSRITRQEWSVILLLMAIQFTHMVDFVIIMPLGKRLQTELAISPSQFGYIVAVYAWAAGIASVLASFVMDRFDRKSVLLAMYGGFGLSTWGCGLATTYETLLIARTLAGVFGGVASVTILAMIGDVFPTKKRGRASGAVMSAFAVASIAGLPAGLMLAEWYGRGAPFIALAGLSAAVWVVVWWRLPSVRVHLAHPRSSHWAEFKAVLRVPAHWWAFIFSFFLVLGTFTVASFVGPVLASDNHWSEGDLAVIYLFAGICTLLGMNIVGWLSDRLPRLPLFRVFALGALVMALVISHLPPGPLWLGTIVVSGFMVFAAGRMVPAQAMLLSTALPRVRGSFMSLNNAVQHLATGLAPAIAGAILIETPEGKLTGFPTVGLIAAAAAAISMLLAGGLVPATQPAPITTSEIATEPVSV